MKQEHILSSLDIYNSPDDYQRYSVSKIKTYKECSQMYKLRYVDKIDTYSQSNATLVGTLLHSSLEYLYGTEDDEVQTCTDAFFKILMSEFANLGFYSAEAILGDLLDYHQDVSNLYLRASSKYEGSDAIRTGKGEVPKAPEMTGIWKSECKKLKLDERKDLIDYTVKTSKKGFENVSITEVFSKALILATNYNTPSCLEEILHLELPISHWDKASNTLINPVPFPNSNHKDIYLNGYIDNISRINYNGQTVTAVIDYKTSKEVFDINIVKHNQQLLMYAVAASQLIGEEVTHIGILSIIKNDLVVVPVDKDLQLELITLFNKIIDKSLAQDFMKHFPDSKYSNCLNSFGGVCPFLENCWPDAYSYLNRNSLMDDYLNSIK